MTMSKWDELHNQLMAFQEFSKNLLKYFNGTIISTSFVLPSAGVFPVIFILDLNHWQSVKLSFGSSF